MSGGAMCGNNHFQKCLFTEKMLLHNNSCQLVVVEEFRRKGIKQIKKVCTITNYGQKDRIFQVLYPVP